MGLYYTFANKAFKRKFTYKVNTFFMIFTAIISLVVQVSIWASLYGGRTAYDGVTLTQMITFVMINQVVSSLTRSNVGNTLAGKAEDGSIVSDLLRPVSLKYYLIAESLGEAFYEFVFSSLPVCLVGLLFLPVLLPGSLLQAALFLASLCLGVVLIQYINYTLGLVSFWLKRSLYVNWVLGAVFTLFGGAQVPLWFYPAFLRNIAMALPFRYVTYEPVTIYLGQKDILQSVMVLVVQALWVGAFAVLERLLWQKAQRVVTIQGG